MTPGDNAQQDTLVSPGSDMRWLDNLTIQCRGVKLQLTQGFQLQESSAELVSLFKAPVFVRDYVQCLAGVSARNVVEVGIKHGGSAIFFWNLMQPERMCCIELADAAEQLSAYVEQQGLGDRLFTHFGTDQADRPRLAGILNQCFGDAPLDVVIDDASHLYTPSLATFEVLFPRLRTGGLYFLEDWKVHVMMAQHGREPHGDEPPLHRLVHQLLDISLAHPDVISRVICHHNFVVLERGKGRFDSLDVQAMLAADREVIEY